MIENISKNFIIVYKDESLENITLDSNFILNNSLLSFISNSSLKIVNNYNNLIPNIADIYNLLQKKGLKTTKIESSFGIGHFEDFTGGLSYKTLRKVIDNKDKVFELLDIEKGNITFEEDLLKSALKNISNPDIEIVNVVVNVDYKDRGKVLKTIYKINSLVTKLKVLKIIGNNYLDIDSPISQVLHNYISVNEIVTYIQKETFNDYISNAWGNSIPHNVGLITKIYSLISIILNNIEKTDHQEQVVKDLIKDSKNPKKISKPLEIVLSYDEDKKYDDILKLKCKEVDNSELQQKNKNYLVGLINSVLSINKRNLISNYIDSKELEYLIRNITKDEYVKYMITNIEEVQSYINSKGFDVTFNSKINLQLNKNKLDSLNKKEGNENKNKKVKNDYLEKEVEKVPQDNITYEGAIE